MTSYGPARDSPRYLVAALSDCSQVEKALAGASVQDVLGTRLQTLKHIVDDVQSELAKRRALSVAVLYLIQQHYLYVKAKLLELARWPLSSDRAIEQRRSKLEDTLDQLSHEFRREYLECWQDTTRLKRELWDWYKQHADLVARVQLLLPDEARQENARNG